AAESEEVAEDVREVGEDVRVEARAALRARDAGMAELVVARTLLGIAEHGVGLGRFLEAFFRLRIVRIAIGVVLQREATVRTLDLPVISPARDAQDVVVVAPAHARATFTMA